MPFGDQLFGGNPDNTYPAGYDDIVDYLDGRRSSLLDQGETGALASIRVIPQIANRVRTSKPTVFPDLPDMPARLELRGISQKVDEEGEFFQKFILTSVEQASEERVSLFPTFESDVLMTFGQRPLFLECSGYALNKAGEGGWLGEFRENYSKKYRAQALVRQKKILYLHYGFVVCRGYMINFRISQVSDSGPSDIVRFSFTLYVKDEIPIKIPSDKWSWYKAVVDDENYVVNGSGFGDPFVPEHDGRRIGPVDTGEEDEAN